MDRNSCQVLVWDFAIEFRDFLFLVLKIFSKIVFTAKRRNEKGWGRFFGVRVIACDG